jgi:hypothetical protein
MKHLLICLALAGAAFAASAQTLWRGVPMNASPAEVRALIAEAQDTPVERRSQDRGALLEIPSYPIAGENFAVTFWFDAERLQRIQLLAKPGSRERTRALAQELTMSLRARYGLPISTKARQDALPGAIDLKWAFRRMTVQLQVPDGVTVDLLYSADIPSRPSGL